MSETTDVILLNLQAMTKQIVDLMRLVIQTLQQGFQLLASVMGIGKNIGRSTLGKEAGITTQGSFLDYVKNFFGGSKEPKLEDNTEIKPDGPGGLKGMFLSMGKSLQTTFKGVSSSIMNAFNPVLLIFQILSPMIQAFLEPLDMLGPLFETWGSILSQLLVPIVILLMDLLTPLTPAFMALVDALLPLVELIVMFIEPLTPVIVLLAKFLVLVFEFVAVITEGVKWVGSIGLAITAFFTIISESIGGMFDWLSNMLKTLKNTIREGFENAIIDPINKVIQKIKDAFSIFSGGGLDNNTETWW